MKGILLLFLSFISQLSISQTIENHLWKNRVLLIFTDDKNKDEYKNQIKLLENEINELKERKLIIYSFTKTDFSINFENYWKQSTEMYQKFNPKNNNFKVWLIGLDGGIKHSQTEMVTSEKLFAIIDGMPMRIREISSKN